MMKKLVAIFFLFLSIGYIYIIQSSTPKASADRVRAIIASDNAILESQEATALQQNQINYTNQQSAAYAGPNNAPLLGGDSASKSPRTWMSSTVALDLEGNITLLGPAFDNLSDVQRNRLAGFIKQNCTPASITSLEVKNDPLKVLAINGQTVYGCVREGVYKITRGIAGQTNNVWSKSAIMVDAQGNITVSGAALESLDSDQVVSFQSMIAQQCTPTNAFSLSDALKQNPYELTAGNAEQVNDCVKGVYTTIVNNE